MQGLLLINKPKDITSFKAVATVRKKANTKKVGHTGTLDPLATGVLPVLIGRATSLCDYLLTADKSYVAAVKAGISTDTLDITGEILSQKSPDFTKEELLSALEHFKGEQLQTPPMYSAIKKDGVPLYKLARKGQEIEIEKRNITVHRINLLEFSKEDYTFKIEVGCSKGTYIRSLCRDIGEYLGCGATLTQLTRTKTGGFSLENCVDLNDLTEENISSYLLSEELAVAHLPVLSVSFNQAKRFSNGGKLSFDRLNADIKEDICYRVKYLDNFIGIGFADKENKEIRIKCLINPIKDD